MTKKKDDSIKNALRLGTKRELKKNTTKNISKIEEAAQEIHEDNPIKKEENYKPEVKKTSLHIPIELYTTLKMEAFKRNTTLRKLIINALNEKFS